MQSFEVSTFAYVLFLGTVAILAVMIVAAVTSAYSRSPRVIALCVACLAVWLGISYAIAESGLVSSFATLPPPFMVLFATYGLTTTLLAFSRVGERLIERIDPIWLVGYQAFRIPVELFLARMHEEGVVPVQMTYSGYNLDILSGVLALALAAVIWRSGRVPRTLTLAFNWIGLALLINIVTVAVLSTPVPFRVFMNEPANTFVVHPPWVWLPTFLVQGALFGHLLIFRLLARSRTTDA